VNKKTNMTENTTLFKLEIIEVTPLFIVFDMRVGYKPDDTFSSTYNLTSYKKGILQLGHKEFSDFAIRLVAYVYTKMYLPDEILEMLWKLNLNIFDSENVVDAKSIFTVNKSKLLKKRS
jgi:hypothetical protein